MTDNIVHKMQSAYTHGKLITDNQWVYLNKIYNKVQTINRKEKYLHTELDLMKKSGVTELFLGADLEEFFILTESSKAMFSMLMDIEDYLSYDLDEEKEVVFENDREALKAVKNVFIKLEKIKSDVDEYLCTDFE